MYTHRVCSSRSSEEESMVRRYESGYQQRSGDETTSPRHGRCGEEVERYDIEAQCINEANIFSCSCSISSEPKSVDRFHHQDPLDSEIPLHVITHAISKEKIKAQNVSNFITEESSVTDSMMESKMRLMSETEKLEKKRDLMRREGNKTVQTLKSLEKFLSDHVDKKMKKYNSEVKKKSSSDDVSKSEWRISVDVLYDFVHESVVDEDGMLKYKEDGSTILDRHGNPLHYTFDQQKEQLSTNFEGKHAHWWDHVCCRTVNRFSTFYQRFWWHCSMWLCIDIFAIVCAILLIMHIWQKYDSLPSKLIEEGISGSMTFDF